MMRSVQSMRRPAPASVAAWGARSVPKAPASRASSSLTPRAAAVAQHPAEILGGAAQSGEPKAVFRLGLAGSAGARRHGVALRSSRLDVGRGRAQVVGAIDDVAREPKR